MVKTYDFLVGMKDPLGIMTDITPPTVSIPKERGVESITTTLLSPVSPHKIPP